MAQPPAFHLAFEPIPRKLRVSSGWTEAKQRGFIAALAESGNVRVACEAVGMSYANVHKLRANPGAEDFNRAWDAALAHAVAQVRDVLIDQAINGVPEPIVYGGAVVGERRRFNHRTMMWLLHHHMPATYAPHGRGFERKAKWERPLPPIEEVQAEIMRKLAALRAGRAREAERAERAEGLACNDWPEDGEDDGDGTAGRLDG